MARAGMQITGKGHYKWKSPKCLSHSDSEEVHLNAIKCKMDKKNFFVQQNFSKPPLTQFTAGPYTHRGKQNMEK